MASEKTYKVIFRNQEEIYEIFARSVGQGSLFGFVEVEQLVFNEDERIVVDPGQEQLQSEFKGVKRIFVPLHAIVRIDEVEREGPGRVTKSKDAGNVARFPGTIYANPDEPADKTPRK